MVCDKDVCDRWAVEAAEVVEAEPAGYRIKNKNPTRRCGEKHDNNVHECMSS